MRSQLKRLCSVLLAAAFVLILLPAPAKAAGNAWDGKTIDVSWYSAAAATFDISTPAQLMGLAAIVNGIYNSDITAVIGDKSYIVANSSVNQNINVNNKSTDLYYYGADSFKGKTVRLTADLDMGGQYDPATETWSGPNYMPIGGQYLMTPNDASTKLSSSFCGIFDGQGHTIYNIYCSRRCTTGNYGDGQSVGLIGRLGVHDNDPPELRPTDPAVKNVAVTGYIYSNRSVGGIVGKLGKTTRNSGDGSTGGIIQNCANFATVSNTDAKGCGGIAGAGWNGGIIENCYNAGRIMSTYTCPTGGISGSNEITLKNCYSVGTISAQKDSYAMAIGTNNGGAPFDTSVVNCWYLDGSAPGGGYYSTGSGFADNALTADKMKTGDFAKTLGDAFAPDTNGVNGGYPILSWQKDIRTPYLSAYSDVSVTSWYFGAVSYVMAKGLFDKTGDAVFGPEQPMTRAMLTAALYRLAGSPAVTETSAFTDVPAGAAYAAAAAWACGTGVVTGTDSAAFNPDGAITREQIAAMLYRYARWSGAGVEALGDLSSFTDAGSVSTWAQDAMRWAVGKKLLSGTGDGSLSPQGTATRAQAAQILLNFSGLVSPE
jgi:hypothetical protein